MKMTPMTLLKDLCLTAAMALALAVGSPSAQGNALPTQTADGFAIPQPGRQFTFPRDHGSHPEFAIEWWYITGHLTGTDQSAFGFQATFFRRAVMPPGTTNEVISSTFGNDQIYLAHMALVDKTSGTFRWQEKLNRAGWDAAASTNTMDVRNGNWSLRLLPAVAATYEDFKLQATIGTDIAFQFNLTPKKPLVIFGTNGVSRKAADPAAASHYLTFPRLNVTGQLTAAGTNRTVTGEAWMDHEFSSSQLGAGEVGWDWLSVQLFDGRELMTYRMRRSDGTTDPFSTVAWIDAQGRVAQTGMEQFKWTVLQTWHSPKSGAEYPSLVQFTALNPTTGQTETFIIEPFVADQELPGKAGSVGYWEGACRVRDASRREIGRAYLELTGYNESLKGKF